MSTLTLVPAYGRDYKSKKEVMEAFDADKDFIINDMSCKWDGKPANKKDLVGQYSQVNIRYKKHTQIAVVKLPSQ